MKNKLYVYSVLIFIMLLFIVSVKLYKFEDENIKVKVNKIFWEAIIQESAKRLSDLKIPYVYFRGTPNDKTCSKERGIIVRNRSEERFIPYDESNPKPTEEAIRVLNVHQSYLSFKSPILIEQLDSFFQKELENNKIKTKTFLYFRDNKNDREGWNCPYIPSLFPSKDICLDSIEVGMQKELFLKAYVHYPYMFVAEKVSKKLFPYATFPLAAIILFIGFYYNFRYFGLKRNRKGLIVEPVGTDGNLLNGISDSECEESNSICEYIEPPQKPRADICWDDRIMTFYVYEHVIVLSRQNFHLLMLFLSKPDGILTKDEISKTLWGNLHDAQTRLIKCMQRFRASFDGIPEIEILTVKTNYYQFIIHRRPTDCESAPEPATDPSTSTAFTPDSETTSDLGPASGSKPDSENSSPEDLNGACQ